MLRNIKVLRHSLTHSAVGNVLITILTTLSDAGHREPRGRREEHE